MSKFVGGKKGSSVDLGKNTPAGVYSLADQYQGTRLGGWDGGIVATGGIISDYQEPTGELYRAHIFLAPGTFTVTSTGKSGDTTYDSTVDLMVVGSGGGGSIVAIFDKNISESVVSKLKENGAKDAFIASQSNGPEIKANE